MARSQTIQQRVQAEAHSNLGGLLRLASRDFQRRSIQKLAELGFRDLKSSHAALLVNLNSDGARLVDLAGRASITKQSMAAVADELELLGYIGREPDPSDRRARIIRLTERGRKLMSKWNSVVNSVLDDYSTIVGGTRVTRLARDLEKLVDSIEVRHD